MGHGREAGHDLVVVAEPDPPAGHVQAVRVRLGHTSITTTVDLYGYLVPEASARARDALDKAFRSALDVP